MLSYELVANFGAHSVHWYILFFHLNTCHLCQEMSQEAHVCRKENQNKE